MNIPSDLVSHIAADVAAMMKELRRRASMSQAEVAERLREMGMVRVSPSAVARMEDRGPRHLARGILQVIAFMAALGYTGDEIFHGLHQAVDIAWARYIRERRIDPDVLSGSDEDDVETGKEVYYDGT